MRKPCAKQRAARQPHPPKLNTGTVATPVCDLSQFSWAGWVDRKREPNGYGTDVPPQRQVGQRQKQIGHVSLLRPLKHRVSLLTSSLRRFHSKGPSMRKTCAKQSAARQPHPTSPSLDHANVRAINTPRRASAVASNCCTDSRGSCPMASVAVASWR